MAINSVITNVYNISTFCISRVWEFGCLFVYLNNLNAIKPYILSCLAIKAVVSALTTSFRTQSGCDVTDDNNSHVCLCPRLSPESLREPLRVWIILLVYFFPPPCTSWHSRRMADGPEADVDDPPSMHFPPLITVSGLPGTTAAGNRGFLWLGSPLDMSWVVPCYRAVS